MLIADRQSVTTVGVCAEARRDGVRRHPSRARRQSPRAVSPRSRHRPSELSGTTVGQATAPGAVAGQFARECKCFVMDRNVHVKQELSAQWRAVAGQPQVNISAADNRVQRA